MLELSLQSINGWLYSSYIYIAHTYKYVCILYAIMIMNIHNNVIESMQCFKVLSPLTKIKWNKRSEHLRLWKNFNYF